MDLMEFEINTNTNTNVISHDMHVRIILKSQGTTFARGSLRISSVVDGAELLGLVLPSWSAWPFGTLSLHFCIPKQSPGIARLKSGANVVTQSCIAVYCQAFTVRSLSNTVICSKTLYNSCQLYYLASFCCKGKTAVEMEVKVKFKFKFRL
jgi:hypothetical protein